MHSSSWTFRPVFTTLSRVPKTRTHSAPVLSRVPALRQHIPGITLGLSFLGHPTPSRLAAWSPAPALSERALDGFPRSVCPFSVTVGRCSTPRPSYRVNTTYAHTTWPNGDVSLLGLRMTAVSQVLTHDAYASSSKILPIVTCLGRSPLSASSLSPSRPCTPTFDNQSRAVGRCYHFST